MCLMLLQMLERKCLEIQSPKGKYSYGEILEPNSALLEDLSVDRPGLAPLPHNSSVTLDKLLDISESQFPHLQCGNNLMPALLA